MKQVNKWTAFKRAVAFNLRRMRGRMALWSTKKIVTVSAVACTATVSALGGGIALYNHSVKTEPEPVVEVAEKKAEKPKTKKVVTTAAGIPVFNPVTITCDSIEKDLTIYITDANGTKIKGNAFQVKLLDKNAKKQLEPYANEVTAVNKAIETADADGSGALDFDQAVFEKLLTDAGHTGELTTIETEQKEIKLTRVNDSKKSKKVSKAKGLAIVAHAESVKKDAEGADKTDTDTDAADKEETKEDENAGQILKADGTPLTNKDMLLLQKQKDIDAYKAQLEAAKGNTYTDDDSDGMIYIKKHDAGKYDLAMLPAGTFEASTVFTQAEIKQKIEYKAVKNIEKKVVKNAGDEKPAEAAKVEAVVKDTVEYVESRVEKVAEYHQVAAKKPEKFPSKTAQDAVNGGPALTDAEGNTLYIDNKGSKEAKLSDYKDNGVYYKKVETEKKYGWQIEGGATVYYDKNGNKVTGDQTISGVQYTFNSAGIMTTKGLGIDVSKYQGNIDWGQASQMVSTAIIRAGRRDSKGNLGKDEYFDRNMREAKAHGVRVGIYFYSTAYTEAQAVEEASLAVQYANEAGGCQLPIYMDVEGNMVSKLDSNQLNAVINAFVQTVRSAGYRAGVYSSKNTFDKKINVNALSSSGVSIWCARYNGKISSCGLSCKHDMWQYTSSGSVPGINGRVDMNHVYF